MFKFQTLKAWEKAVEFADIMIEIAESLPRRYFYSFGNQLINAALSITNNIAEASGRRRGKESANFYNIAKGSIYECISILVILSKRGLIDWKRFNKERIYKLGDEIARMLSGLIR